MTTKKPSTRAGRAVQKASKLKKTQQKKTQIIEAKQPEKPVAKLANVLGLTRQSIAALLRHKKTFLGIIIIYGLLNIVFVSGFSQGINASEAKSQFTNAALGSLAAYAQLIGSTASAPGEAASVYQLFLGVFVSLALIWTLRQSYAGHTVRIRDAYYKSMHPLVPFLLIGVLICVQLLPMIVGVALYQFVVTSGIATSSIEVILWFSVAVLGILISAYFATRSIIGLIIVTLPDMSPMSALKLAKKLVTGRHWTVLRKLLFLPLLLLVITSIVLLPFIFIYAPLAQIVLLVLTPLLVAIGHSYIYAVYRGLVGE